MSNLAVLSDMTSSKIGFEEETADKLFITQN